MAHSFNGIVEVQSDPGDITQITLDPNAADITAGGSGQSGDIILNDASGNEVIRLGRVQEPPDVDYAGLRIRTPAAVNVVQVGRTGLSGTIPPDDVAVIVGGTGFSGALRLVDNNGSARLIIGRDDQGHDGRLIVLAADGNALLEFDPSVAALYVGGQGNEGDVIVRDAASKERIKLDAGQGDIRVRDAAGNTLMLFDSGAAALYVGGQGNEGDVIVRDAASKERIKLDAGQGDIRVRDAAGNTLMLFDSGAAALYVGGQGNEGDVIVRDAASKERIKLDAGEGDIRVRDAAGNTLMLFDSGAAALYVGGEGNEGDVIVRNGDGVQTIKLDGGLGDIILSNADCAEEFDASEGAPPGTVMVIGDDERIEPSALAYDRRVAGVVSGGGPYRPGIVLDRRAAESERPAVALVGKVYCRVDGTHGAIDVGDLLVSSPTPGHAMVGADSSRCPGAVLGKALRRWSGGRGLIPILVALQ